MRADWPTIYPKYTHTHGRLDVSHLRAESKMFAASPLVRQRLAPVLELAEVANENIDLWPRRVGARLGLLVSGRIDPHQR